MSSTTSRGMIRSWSNASASCVKLTMPSIEFSIGTKPTPTSPGGDRVEHVRHRPVRDELARGEVGLGTQRLLGERAERPEEPDPLRRVGGRARIDRLGRHGHPG